VNKEEGLVVRLITFPYPATASSETYRGSRQVIRIREEKGRRDDMTVH
jgi:hypothetical protein